MDPSLLTKWMKDQAIGLEEGRPQAKGRTSQVPTSAGCLEEPGQPALNEPRALPLPKSGSGKSYY